MESAAANRFLRISNALVEALFHARLSGGQWRVLLWVIRHTHGWNRRSTPFTWYQVAKDVAMDRATAYRSGQALLRAGVLILADAQLGIQEDSENWGRGVLSLQAVDAGQLWMPGMDVVGTQRKPLSGSNASVGKEQRLRCQETTLFRRAKDSSKDKLKTYKNRRGHRGASPEVWRLRENALRRHLAGAARPVPGKYDGLSQN
jgi:phage replication O-like protein O